MTETPAERGPGPAALILLQARRLVVLVIGGTVVLAGVAMLLLPGPGWAAIFLGLAILSAEFVWARVVLKRAKRMAAQGVTGLRRLVFGKSGGLRPRQTGDQSPNGGHSPPYIDAP